MNFRNTALKLALVGVFFSFVTGVTAAKADAEKDIVDTAVAAGSFKTLVKAVQAAGLVDTLKGAGPFTVFAPTDKAFAALEKAKPGTLATLLKPENKATLTAILTYHVVSGKIMAADAKKLKSGTHVKTVNGQSIAVYNKHGIKINKSKVVKADIETSNGVIHVIDSVLLPK
ncbi:MAG: fasciclin domain-containing protein [Armatimonadetes bacterium]|nr:fasciclin domain-containing protein [Armatimonadota bacterium]